MQQSLLNRKLFLIIALLCGISTQQLRSVNNKDDIPATEDLMREHGILNRLLLIYENCIGKIDSHTPIATAAIGKAAKIMQSFIEEYHEKLEEDYLFPLFEKRKKELTLIATLKEQHNKGREITAQLQKLVASNKPLTLKQKKSIKSLLQKFVTMYRPHEAREDTLLFPQVRALLSQKEFDALGDKFEELEHKLFGHNGFETIVNKVAAIEKELGIYNLEKFTPIVSNS